MDFRPTPEQTGFAHSLGELMSGADSVAIARAWAAGDIEPGLTLWRRLAEQGVNALVVPEAAGGLGGSAVDLAVAFEVLGHHLAVGPWIESAAYLARALDGEALAVVVGGSVTTVAVPPLVPLALDAHAAAQVYVLGEDGLTAATAGERHLSVDTTRHLFEVRAAGGLRATTTDAQREPASELPGPPPAAGDDAFELAVLACAAELLGCGERLLAASVAHVKQRKQYGRTIGSYQAIKHALADVRIDLDFARPLVQGAALSISTSSVTSRRDVSAAKIAAGDSAYHASRVALQVHGAIGYTAELDLGLWINRVRALVGAWGGAGFHRDRIARSLAGSLPAGDR
jgi:alkylation response protein AidB-like acyl-CoA dehydrogenase